ncbi:hypothetical protein ADJ73_09145 [Arsenicicoccus sp. oral taxon 190]|nr:hypothetical protein ADJ73_09145 [Arsenicicoccus sp. oral taxon 190]
MRLLQREGTVLAEGAAATGYAVTAAVVAELANADEEEREYDALLEAAAQAGVGATGRRRVVAAADLPTAAVEDLPGGYAEVRVTGPVSGERVVAFHVDETVAHEDADLLWYDVTELGDVLRLLEQP